MNNQKQKHNWWIDAFLLLGYLLCFFLDLTGIFLHQWLGVGLAVLMLIHILVHWDWVVAITRRFFSKPGNRNRWYYLIDLTLGLGFVLILETGLVISTWFNLALTNYTAWLDLHIYSSVTTLILTVIKIGLHWRWVVNITGKIFGSPKPQVLNRQPALVPIQVQPQVMRVNSREIIDRRKFLTLMGVVGVSSAIAIQNVLRNKTISLAEAAIDPGEDLETGATQATAQVVQAQETTTTSIPTTVNNTAATATPQATATPYTVASVQDSTTGCTVRCSRGCSYPGHCRRYTDQNNNRKCDLGECL